MCCDAIICHATICIHTHKHIYACVHTQSGCLDTIVGNAMIRGVSGGQRKRVTLGTGVRILLFLFFIAHTLIVHFCTHAHFCTGEMLVTDATVLFLDEISTGLDSQTIYEIVKALQVRWGEEGVGGEGERERERETGRSCIADGAIAVATFPMLPCFCTCFYVCMYVQVGARAMRYTVVIALLQVQM